MNTVKQIPQRFAWLVLAPLVLIVGCASGSFEHALARSIDDYRVTDAAARHTGAGRHLRFNALLLDDLDNLLATEQPSRSQAAELYRAAADLALTATHGEIERLPADARRQLAAQAGTSASAAALCERFDQDATVALDRDLRQIQGLSPKTLHRKLLDCRRRVEPLPDDRGRLTRQLMLGWAALPTWIGLENEEAKLRAKSDAKIAKKFERVAVWRPDAAMAGDDLLARFAPILAVEWPRGRTYADDDDRIGGVHLRRAGQDIDVHVDPTAPQLYALTWQARIHGQCYKQLVYTWWLPERPEMTRDDPAAGHIDGGMLRLTLGANGNIAIAETSLSCGCGHQVFVAKGVENAAEQQYGAVLRDKRFAVEQHIRGKHDVIVIDTFTPPDPPARPVLYLAAGYHEVCQLKFTDPGASKTMQIADQAAYRLAPYAALDSLPLGDGVGSMFGPDGLVHDAGRPEGYLLAPTGMLSAGQPRKCGTHRIRWDDFVFDDPHLLERTLRLPSGL